MGEKKGPTHEVKLGRIRAAIWMNQSQDADVWFNVTVSRLFKKDGKWHDSESFRRDDLPIVITALGMAYVWIWIRQEAFSETTEN